MKRELCGSIISAKCRLAGLPNLASNNKDSELYVAFCTYCPVLLEEARQRFVESLHHSLSDGSQTLGKVNLPSLLRAPGSKSSRRVICWLSRILSNSTTRCDLLLDNRCARCDESRPHIRRRMVKNLTKRTSCIHKSTLCRQLMQFWVASNST